MNPFKKGDKVKAIDNVINRCNIAGDLSNGRIMEVMDIVDDHLLLDGVYMHYSRFTIAEPPAKFANVNPDEWTVCTMPDGDKIYMLTENQAEQVRTLFGEKDESI